MLERSASRAGRGPPGRSPRPSADAGAPRPRRARSYAALLEADGHNVGACAAATSELFALADEARAVVVWFRAAHPPGGPPAAPPLPAELAMLLRDSQGER